jgi:hypothetical protein
VLGKESNRLEEVEAGLVHDPEEVYTEYVDLARDPWATLVVPVLRQMLHAQLVAGTRVARSTLTRLRNGHTRPHPVHRTMLIRAAGDFARAQLEAASRSVRREDLAACAAWLAHNDGSP